MRDHRPALVLLVLFLAGCTGAGDAPLQGGEPGQDLDQAGTGTSPPGTAASATLTPLRMHEERLVETLWANGTLRAEQAGTAHDVLPTVGLGGAAVALDLTPSIPRGVPVVLEAEVTADLERGDLDLWLEAPQDALWTYQADAPYGGRTLLRVAMLYTGGDPVHVMLYYDVLEGPTEVPYALRASLFADPDLLVPGVPYALPLGPGQALELQFQGEAEETVVLLYRPDDTLQERVVVEGDRLRFDLAPDAVQGDSVLVLAAGSRPASVRLGGAEGPVVPRALGQDIVVGTARTFDASQGAEWTFASSRPPLQVGFEVGGATVARNMQARLEGPAGEIFALEFLDDLPWIGGVGWGFFTGVGQEGLLSGAYTARLHYETAAGDPLVATEYVVHYRR